MNSIIIFMLGFCAGFGLMLIGIIINGVDNGDNK